MTEDERAIRALLDRYEAAIRDKDANAVVGCYADDIVAYDLAPPLAIGPSMARDPACTQHWFATWTGPIGSTAHDMTVRVGGDIGYAFTLRRMTGTKADGTHVELWFRATAAFARRDGAWKITHIHNSVPFAMDGSGRALLDLVP